MNKYTAYISVGSNLGDKLFNCRQGIDALTKDGRTVLIAQSRFYKTEPVDFTDQDWFVNAVVKTETVLEPFQLLEAAKAVEAAAGRDFEAVRFGPRVLDLDILLYDDRIVDSPSLMIPHPRMHKRRFVLGPICDIDPHICHPVLKSPVARLLDNLGTREQRILLYK